jgi:hypothetical protein
MAYPWESRYNIDLYLLEQEGLFSESDFWFHQRRHHNAIYINVQKVETYLQARTSIQSTLLCSIDAVYDFKKEELGFCSNLFAAISAGASAIR